MLPGNNKSQAGISQQKLLLAELLLKSGQSASQHEIFPASLAQQRLWFLEQLGTKTSAYNVHLGFWLRGPLDMEALQASIQEVINRHATLRTSFRLEGRELVQVVAHDLRASLPITDIVDTPFPELYPRAYALAKVEVEAPFDLAKGPLFRTILIRATPNDHVLLCTMHHIITDAWSTQILARELSSLYTAFSAGRTSNLTELPVTYGDFSEWQRNWFKTSKVQEQLNFWKSELEDAPPFLQLQMQRPRSEEQTFQGSSQTVQLNDVIIKNLKALAVRLHATPFMLLLAAFKILLLRASGQPDILVGVPVAGRNRVEVEDLVGFFVNTLVLRDDLSGNPAFADFVAQIRETTLGAFANSDVPFEKVVEVLQPERNLSYNPIFQVMFAVIKSAVQSHSFGDLEAFPYVVTPNTSIFDLGMTIIEGVDGLWFAQIDYNTDLFSSEDVGRLLAGYTTLLQSITSTPEKKIEDLDGPTFASPDILAENLRATTRQTQRSRSKRSSHRDEHPHEVAVSGGSVCRTTGRSSTSGKHRKRKGSQSHALRRVEVTQASLPEEEKLLLKIWRDLIRSSEIGIDDNFFEVGGHSLLAAQVIAQLQAATNLKIPVSAVFRAPTIRLFARLMREDAVNQPDPVALKLKSGSSGIPFFGVAIPGVDTFGFAQLSRHVAPDQAVYKLQAAAPVVVGRPLSPEELQSLAAQYVQAMRAEQPRGPYCLGAMCEGVLIAQQMILLLESQGDEVALFAIFDTWVLENSQIPSLWAIDYYTQRLRTFRAASFRERLSTLRRLVNRALQKDANPGSGWNRIYWPDEDFVPPQFHAPVLLFKRPKQPYFYVRDPNMGWADRSLGGVTTCELKCGHAEMLREPHVRKVAHTLTTHLQIVKNALSPDDSRRDSDKLAGTAA